MVYLTSGCTIKQVAIKLKVSKSFVERTLQKTLDNIQAPLKQFFPANQTNIQCELTFENHPEAFCIVDASPVFIRRPAKHQTEYYSEKYKRHCVKVQACLTPDGQCVHLSKVYRGRTHDKAIFDSSALADFLVYHAPGSDAPRHRIIIADLRYVGITRSCPNALLLHKKEIGWQLTADQKQENQFLSRGEILIENFFGRWKTLFGVCHEAYRGDLKSLSRIIRATIAMTNWYICRHPLRRANEELVEESDSEHGGPTRELDQRSSSNDE
jgi:hypothetical protein